MLFPNDSPQGQEAGAEGKEDRLFQTERAPTRSSCGRRLASMPSGL